jgi:ribosome-associated protein
LSDLDPRARARIVADAADSKKGENIVVLDVGDIMSLAEIFVIVSAPNTRLVRTLVDAIDERMRATAGARPRTVEGLDTATWVLLDYGDVVVHVQHAEERTFYALERLWRDCPFLPFTDASAGSSRPERDSAEAPEPERGRAAGNG